MNPEWIKRLSVFVLVIITGSLLANLGELWIKAGLISALAVLMLCVVTTYFVWVTTPKFWRPVAFILLAIACTFGALLLVGTVGDSALQALYDCMLAGYVLSRDDDFHGSLKKRLRKLQARLPKFATPVMGGAALGSQKNGSCC